MKDKLTKRETQVLTLVAEGKANKEAADILGLSVRTVESHRVNASHKLGLRCAADVTRFAIRSGLTVALCALTCSAATVLSGSGNITMSGNITFTAIPAPVDTNAPYVTGASLAADGVTFYITNSEAMQRQEASGSFTNNQSQAMTYSSGSNSTLLVYTVPTVIYSNSTVKIGNTNASGWHDAATNYLAIFGNTNVVNNSTNVAGPPGYFFQENWGPDMTWSWIYNVGDANYTGSYKLDGAASLAFTNESDVALIKTNKTIPSECSGYAMLNVVTNHSVNAYTYLSLALESTPQFAVSTLVSGGLMKWKAEHGTSSIVTNTVSSNQVYHLWWHYKKSTGGNDGQYHLWVSTDTSKGDFIIGMTNGTSTADCDSIMLGGNTITAIWDKLYFATNAVPDSP